MSSTRDLSAEPLGRGSSSSSEEKPLQFAGVFVFGSGCQRFKRAAGQGSGGARSSHVGWSLLPQVTLLKTEGLFVESFVCQEKWGL